MKVDIYERMWMWGASIMIVCFLAAIIIASVTQAVNPPSHMETIDPATVYTDSEFADPRVVENEDGSYTVILRAQLYAFRPEIIRVPAGVPVTFRMTSPDVIHGFQIVGTNANATVVPGYVTEFTVTFHEPGEKLLVCNEYCGLSHHLMQGSIIVGPPGGAVSGERVPGETTPDAEHGKQTTEHGS